MDWAVFFCAIQPETLGFWRSDTLGIDFVPTSEDQKPWMSEGGPTVFVLFAAETKCFDVAEPFKMNFKMRDLVSMVAQLERAGSVVTLKDSTPVVGEFAHLEDL